MRISNMCVLIVAAGALSAAQAQTPLISAPSGTKTLAATLEVYAFPGAGQSASQQSQDETECYNWAGQETGLDPFHIANQAAEQQQQAAQQQQQAQQSTSGSAVKGAVDGAPAGRSSVLSPATRARARQSARAWAQSVIARGPKAKRTRRPSKRLRSHRRLLIRRPRK